MVTKPFTVTARIPEADQQHYCRAIEEGAEEMCDGIAKGYNPGVSRFIADCVPGQTNVWQAQEAIAKTVRMLNKLQRRDYMGANRDATKIMTAIYTVKRDFIYPNLAKERNL